MICFCNAGYGSFVMEVIITNILKGLKRVPGRDLKSTISVNCIFHGVPRAPWYKDEASMSLRNFARMVLYLSRSEHPLLSREPGLESPANWGPKKNKQKRSHFVKK